MQNYVAIAVVSLTWVVATGLDSTQHAETAYEFGATHGTGTHGRGRIGT